MKNFKFFYTREDYERFIWNDVFPSDLIRNNPFYHNLIQWVIDNRTPLFFEASDESEYAHFSQYFGMVLMRKYDNPVVQSMYYLHDFVHMTMYYPLYPQSMTFENFRQLAIDNEHVASNETEIMAFRRIKDLRAEMLTDQTILFDLLTFMQYDMWTPLALLELRRTLSSGDAVWALFRRYEGAARKVKKYMSHISNNQVWCGLWYDQVPYIYGKPFWFIEGRYLNYENFPAVVANYVGGLSATSYINNTLSNARLWSALALGEETHYRMEDIPALLERMEGKIILPEAARIFNLMYQAKQAK